MAYKNCKNFIDFFISSFSLVMLELLIFVNILSLNLFNDNKLIK